MRVKAVSTDAYNEFHEPIRGNGGGVGPVRHAVGAHALGERQVAGQLLPLLGLGRRLVRPQGLAGSLGRSEAGTADPDLRGRGYLRELSAAVWVRVGRHPVGAHATGVADR